MSSLKTCHFLLPGDWNTPTGGYAYDRRLAAALREVDWSVMPLVLDGAWPCPDQFDLITAEALVQALPDNALVVADGLAFGCMPDVALRHARRLRWVALVHHPLHLETGWRSEDSARLRESEARALQCARRVVVTSRSTVADVTALGVSSSRITVVEPGTDPVPSRSETPRRNGVVRLLCVASLIPRKGHAVLLEALTGLQHLPWELHLVGNTERDPGFTASLQAMAEPLKERVVWHGELPPEALQAHYLAADVFVLPSLYEGYGMVVAEAVAHGLPVVTTDGGALARTLPPRAGLKVPAGDVLKLQAALGRVLTDPALHERLATGAREAAALLPTWPQQAARFAATLGSVA
ncbi:glycosyltransferase family 4 protein [Hydrogenophaga laconesensis]|uniref:Glycosyltransferase involved in cell wall biosynthesis n=1 Tax=Hydrogenophaga laconesensis TaxID=1805971 RepID=A0ABU1VDS0_9BURK|nr:glycosyltransferase family 4 protein [Hydrogenophaga laconesensis]MDR7095592.1 glycosyltransferase involved in cell wall biosynthesis [Hydrogenophaga laconesensis]